MRDRTHGRLTPAMLSDLVSAAGLALPAGAAEKLIRHADELALWNRAIRLTAITDPGEVAVKHILDSLLLLHFAPFPGRTLDFGSGAGYPGIPLAIALPEAQVVLLESSGKKCAFLSHVCAMLGLRNTSVVRGRLGTGTLLPLGRFDAIVTRATLPPEEAAAVLAPYLAGAGRLLLMIGPGATRRPGRKGRAPSPPGPAETRRRRFALPMGMGEREIAEYA